MPTQIKYNPKSRLTTSLRNRFPLAPTNHSHTPNSPLIEKGLTLLLMRQPDSPPLRWIPPPFSRRLNALCQIIAQHRWIEGLWDNCEDWVDGVYLSGSSVYAILDPTNFSDNSNGTWVRTKVTSGGYITAFGISSTSGFEWFMYPSATSGGSQSTYICDGYSTRSTGVALHVGGSYYYPSLDDGLFNHDSYSDNSRGYSYVGTRLIELPQTD